MIDLKKARCSRVKKLELALGAEEIDQFLSHVPNWDSDTFKGNHVVRRKFVLSDYDKARRFVDMVADLAEYEDHHPEIIFGYIYVEVIYWTHVVDGLHMNDFIMASKTDTVYENLTERE